MPGAERPGGILAFISTVPISLGVATGLAILLISPGDYMGFGIPPPAPNLGQHGQRARPPLRARGAVDGHRSGYHAVRCHRGSTAARSGDAGDMVAET